MSKLIKLTEEESDGFPPAGNGFSHCKGNKCYVACDDGWYKFTDNNGNHYSCSDGNGKSFKCGDENFTSNC